MNNEEINIFTLGFEKNLQRNQRNLDSFGQIEVLESRINKMFQSGDTIVSLIPGLFETEYNGI